MLTLVNLITKERNDIILICVFPVVLCTDVFLCRYAALIMQFKIQEPQTKLTSV